MRYHDFELLIVKEEPGKYPLRVIYSPAGQAHGILTIDPDSEGIQKALHRLEACDTDEEFLKDFGGVLFENLFAGGVRDVFRHSLGQVRTDGAGLRIRLRIEPPKLSSLPWEYMYDEDEDFFLATSPEILVSRYIQVARPLVPFLVDLPLRILVVISNPVDLSPLNVDEETTLIRTALRPLIDEKQVELDVLRMATRAAIQSRLQEKEYHVFHFIGHGDFTNNQGLLALIDSSGRCRSMDEKDFADLFLGYSSMRLIVLNACKSAETATERAFVGIAPHLVRRGMPAIIAMRYRIPDRTAILFSEEFYRSLAKGYPVDTAISEARRAILLDVGRGRRDFGIPALFMRAENGVIVEFHSQKTEQIVEGTQEALQTIRNLFEQYALRDGSVAVDKLVGNLTELVKLNEHLSEWIELRDLLHELDVSLVLVCDEVERKDPTEMSISFIQTQWRLWKDNILTKMAAFASGVGYVGEAYFEDDDGQPHGAEWMVDLVMTQRAVDKDLEQLSLMPLRDHIRHLSSSIRRHRHTADRRLREVATALSALSNQLLMMIKR